MPSFDPYFLSPVILNCNLRVLHFQYLILGNLVDIACLILDLSWMSVFAQYSVPLGISPSSSVKP